MSLVARPARYCPAGVYEWIEEEGQEPRFQINSQNCVHCKNLRHQGSKPEHQLGNTRGRRRTELSQYVMGFLVRLNGLGRPVGPAVQIRKKSRMYRAH